MPAHEASPTGLPRATVGLGSASDWAGRTRMEGIVRPPSTWNLDTYS